MLKFCVHVYGTDQLEAWGWLEDRSTVSLVKLEALAISSVMREKSLLKLVTLPRFLDSESKKHLSNMSHRRAQAAPSNTILFLVSSFLPSLLNI